MRLRSWVLLVTLGALVLSSGCCHRRCCCRRPLFERFRHRDCCAPCCPVSACCGVDVPPVVAHAPPPPPAPLPVPVPVAPPLAPMPARP